VLKQGKIYFVETICKSSKNVIKLSFYSIFNRLPDKPQNLTSESIIFNLPFVYRIIIKAKTKTMKSQYWGGKKYY
jgi:hypothetical protein